jgi:peptidoglycan/xylan/chitin deacetylase (PgdA/CDA1 family)
MLLENSLYGESLPEKTLCLTFDDGPGKTKESIPGPKTEKLAKYLHDENIAATFFVVGKYVEEYPEIVIKIISYGHLVGNHTYNHFHLTNLFDSGQEKIVLDEIAKTTAILQPILKSDIVYFRAPYGAWNPNITTYMNMHISDNKKYIGPFHWDISGDDWCFWDKGATAEECAEKYLQLINKAGKGIVLMHDSTADPVSFYPHANRMRQNNLTFETIQLLIPELKKEGYKFVNLDKIPEVASLL